MNRPEKKKDRPVGRVALRRIVEHDASFGIVVACLMQRLDTDEVILSKKEIREQGGKITFVRDDANGVYRITRIKT